MFGEKTTTTSVFGKNPNTFFGKKMPSSVFRGSYTEVPLAKGEYHPIHISTFKNTKFTVIDKTNNFSRFTFPREIDVSISLDTDKLQRLNLELCVGIPPGYVKEQISKSPVCIIAEDNDSHLKGYALISIDHKNEVYLYLICASGAGKLIMALLEDICFINNLPKIILHTANPGLVTFYSKLNFYQVGLEKLGSDGIEMLYDTESARIKGQMPIVYDKSPQSLGGKRRWTKKLKRVRKNIRKCYKFTKKSRQSRRN